MEMGNFYGSTDRNIDLVFCIDGTGSMSGIIDNLKRHAKRFQNELTEALVEANTNITSLRIKVITFRDYADDPDAMVENAARGMGRVPHEPRSARGGPAALRGMDREFARQRYACAL